MAARVKDGPTKGKRAQRMSGRSKTRSDKPKLIDDPIQEERVLNAQLAQLGLYAVDTLGDGNCLFRALSDQLYASFEHHLQLRQQICDYLATHADRFRLFVDEDEGGGFDGHVSSMRMPGTYGTNLELSAFASLYRRPVKVFQPGLIYVIQCDKSDSSKATDNNRSESRLEPPPWRTRSGEIYDGCGLASIPAELTDEPDDTDPSPRAARLRARKARQNEATKHENGGQQELVDTVSASLSERVTEVDFRGPEPINLAYHSYEHYSSLRQIGSAVPSSSKHHADFGNGSSVTNVLHSRPGQSKLTPRASSMRYGMKRERVGRDGRLFPFGEPPPDLVAAESESLVSMVQTENGMHRKHRGRSTSTASSSDMPRQRSRVQSPASSQDEFADSPSSSEASSSPAIDSSTHESSEVIKGEVESSSCVAVPSARRLTGRDKKELRRLRKRELRRSRVSPAQRSRPTSKPFHAQDSLELSSDVAVLYI